MRIAQLAPLAESVPPRQYGGTERVVSWLCEELVRRGHKVTLFASGDSHTAAELTPIVERALRETTGASSLTDANALQLTEVETLCEHIAEFDIIHSHLDYLCFPRLRRIPIPLITTLHGRLDVLGLAELFAYYPGRPLVSISYAQRCPLPAVNWIANIYHGLPLSEYEPGPGGGDYFVFLGRISPEKRPHVAIEVARKAGVRLVIAAKIDRVDRQYFEEAIAPWLDDPLIDFMGEVDEKGKASLLRDARGLLFPILWPEPFGLAMIEAMAYGTPVITRRCGSTPEVVKNEEVGFLCDDDDALLDAIKRIDRIDRRDCRKWVEKRFSAERMADDYERAYRKLCAE